MKNALLITFTNLYYYSMLIGGIYLPVTYSMGASCHSWEETIIHDWLIVSFISISEDITSMLTTNIIHKINSICESKLAMTYSL